MDKMEQIIEFCGAECLDCPFNWQNDSGDFCSLEQIIDEWDNEVEQ